MFVVCTIITVYSIYTVNEYIVQRRVLYYNIFAYRSDIIYIHYLICRPNVVYEL